MASDTALKMLLHLRKGTESRIGADRIRLLEVIGDRGSISAAAKALEISYKGAWDAVQALNNLFDRPLVVAHPGGRSGGLAEVTPAGHAVIAAFRKLEDDLADVTARLERALAASEDPLGPLGWSFNIRTSARNLLGGSVSRVIEGPVNSQVVLQVAEGVQIVAVLTRESIKALGLAPGRRAMALIKSSFVILARGEPLRTSARNNLSGIVLHHEPGAVNDEVILDLGGGKTLTATITAESWRDLGLAVGDQARALIKASHVILAVD